MTNKEKLVEMLMQEIFGSAIFRTEDDIKHIREKLSKVVDHLIANDVVRPKGEWVYDHWCEFKCSKCGVLSKTEPRGGENFCPSCGADMKKEKNG